MESSSSKNKNVKYLLCVIDVFLKYVWVKPLKDKGKTVLNPFIETVNESNQKPNKLWFDQGRELFNKLAQDWLDNNIFMYSTHNEDKSVITERFIKTLKVKIYKKITTNDSKSYLAYLNKLVDHCSNSFHHSINKKLINADYSAYKINDRVRITKYKNIFSKGIENQSREIFIIDSVLKTNPWT